jgi:diguanylate cyclase (GGDEF)-like protein/PAS domain S-box-containing protein
MRLSIDRKYAMTFALLVIVLSLIVLGGAALVAVKQSKSMDRKLQEVLHYGVVLNQTEALQRSASYLSKRLFNPLYKLDISALEAEINQIRLWLPINTFFILDSKGTVLTDGSPENRLYGEPVSLPASFSSDEPMVRRVETGCELFFVIGYGDVVAGYALITLDDTAQRDAIAVMDQSVEKFWSDYSWNLLLLGGVVILTTSFIGILVSHQLSKVLSRPLLQMRDAAYAFARGNLNFSLSIQSDDEVGDLAYSLNRMAQNLRKNTHLLSKAQTIAGLGSWELDCNGKSMIWSEQVYRIFGLDSSSCNPSWSGFLERVREDDHAQLHRLLTQDGPSPITFCEVRMLHPNGAQRLLEFQAESVSDVDGNIQSVIGTVRDVTAQREAENHLVYLANYDTLTGLPNRYLFRDRLAHALGQAKRSGRDFAVLFLDLDKFKSVNDGLGHEAGDQLLCMTAERLRKTVRVTDLVARLGGDEFTILIENFKNKTDLVRVSEKILEALSQPYTLDLGTMHISASIGITTYPEDGESIDTLLKNADIAMFHAKSKGRATYHIFTDGLNRQVQRRLLMEEQLREALPLGQFHLVYQPQVCTITFRLVGVEALLRWNGFSEPVSPQEFIPILEETGLILKVGDWVLEQACAQAKAWQNAGYQELRMAVNLSVRQFQQADLVERVAAILERTGLDAGCLELEITESTLIDKQVSTKTAARLSDLGIRLAIDDFGTGYSSLTYLRRFSVNTLKIDRSFVHDIPEDRDDAAIITAVIGLAHSLGLEIVAEGVETQEQLEFLQKRGCHYAQGYLIGKPVSVGDFMVWSKTHSAIPRLRRLA